MVDMDSSKDTREAKAMTRQPDPKAVDLWVRRSLAENYAEVLREPLPEAWLKLLRPVGQN
jgi:hypothetical protein